MVLKLLKKIQETKNCYTFIFTSDENFTWKAGQFLIYSLNHDNIDVRGKMRFFTISSSPFEKNPSITTRIELVNLSSSFKKALNNLIVGETINAKGPDGDFTIEDYGQKYCFIAGGVGVTPFRSILKQLEFEQKDLDIEFLYSNSDDEFIFKKEFDNLNLKNLSISYFPGQRIGLDQIINIKDYKQRTYYLTGPDQMVEGLEKILRELGIDKENIKSDYFSGYLF